MNDKFLYNNSIFKNRRKELRNKATETEKILWAHLKGGNLGGLKFTRQYSVGPYILDFYCPKVRLAIEIDGTQHGEREAKLYDSDRSDYLSNVGIEIIRFWNNEVMLNLDMVVSKILSKVSKMDSPS